MNFDSFLWLSNCKSHFSTLLISTSMGVSIEGKTEGYKTSHFCKRICKVVCKKLNSGLNLLNNNLGTAFSELK